MTLYAMVKDRPNAYTKLREFAMFYDEFSEDDLERFIDDIIVPTNCLKDYRSVLYDFFDELGILCTITVNYIGNFIPAVYDNNIRGEGKSKQKIYSRGALKTRIEAEEIMFNKAFEYLQNTQCKTN
jgi:hypothetical protein